MMIKATVLTATLFATMMVPTVSHATSKTLTDNNPGRNGVSFSDAVQWGSFYFPVDGWFEFVTDSSQAFIHGMLIEGTLEQGSPDPTLVNTLQIFCNSTGWENVNFAPANGAALTFSQRVECSNKNELPGRARATFWYGCRETEGTDPRPISETDWCD